MADGVISPIVFVAVNAIWGLDAATTAGLVVAGLIVVVRLATGRPLRFALGGVFGTGIAIAVAARSGRAETYFLPGIISGAATSVAILVSVLFRRPFVAYISWVTRGWPLGWFWHDRVRPAYTLVSWIWLSFFAVRTAVQVWLFATEQVTTLGIVRVLTGWPGLLALLVVTFIVGRNRLESLGGPSVEEFEQRRPPPWSVQPHGF